MLAQLFMGDTNRVVSETPMNLAPSRSHCLFALTVEARVVRTKSLLLIVTCWTRSCQLPTTALPCGGSEHTEHLHSHPRA